MEIAERFPARKIAATPRIKYMENKDTKIEKIFKYKKEYTKLYNIHIQRHKNIRYEDTTIER